MDWHKFWTEYPATLGETDFLAQVCHTVGGKPYGAEDFARMIEYLAGALDLGPGDRLLDICCGNGAVTRELARRCAAAAGVDFSATLIDRARRYNAEPNLTYHIGDARHLDAPGLAVAGGFTRVSMFFSLQHLSEADLEPLLDAILAVSAPSAVILFGGVLDRTRKHLYLDTAEKRAAYEAYVREGRDRLGTWWAPANLAAAAERRGLACVIDQTSEGRLGGHYRFDARLHR